MERNFALQKQVDDKRRELQVTELQRDRFALEQRYYQTDEYRELAARESLGLVMPGESVLILPPNSQAAIDADASTGPRVVATQITESNLDQWLNFLFGGYSRSISGE